MTERHSTNPAAPAQALIVVTPAPSGGAAAPDHEPLLTMLRQQIAYPVFGCTTPEITATLRRAAASAARQLVVVPALPGEAHPDMSAIAGALRWAQTTWPDRRILCSAPLLSADQIAGTLARRAVETLRTASEAVSHPDTALVVWGEGRYDRHANAEVAQIARLLLEHLPEYCVEYALLAHTRPTLAATIDRCRAQGAQRIVVLPLAVLPSHLDAYTAAFRSIVQTPACPVVLAGALLTSAGAAAIMLQRARDSVHPARLAANDARPDPLSGTRWAAHQHAHSGDDPAESLLPPRYQGAATVSAAPMGAADLRYDADGQVAWDQIWTDFCDLALAGGPPHRGALLEPVALEAVHADPPAYARVVAELARGLRLVTGLGVLPDRYPGWIGLCCHDEAMALWMLRAIVVENVSVRREGVVLFLPAGPAFRLEGEIKSIITVAAKTHHYWSEHTAGRNAPMQDG